MTKGDRILSVLQDCNSRLLNLQRSSYSDDDVRQIINQGVVAIELFVKDALYSRKRDKKKLEDLINDLPAVHGIDPNAGAPLHEVRRLYNKAHHSVALPFGLGEAISKMQAAGDAVRIIVSQGPGDCGLDARPAFRRVFWIAGWFHANGGDVETDIIIPDETISFTWSAYDSIYLKLKAWNTLESELATYGRVRKSSEAVPASVLKRFEEVEDLVGCFEYEGDYRTLLRILSGHEDRQDLLPDLLRENNVVAMCQAACFAAVDFASSNSPMNDPDQIASGIIGVAERDYAAPASSKALRNFAVRLAGLLSRHGEWATMAGPLPIEESAFDALISEGKATPESPERALFAISADNVLLRAE